MIIPFTKMEGAGNDYVYVNACKIDIPEDDIPEVARIVSDRHFGIGSDGLILICPSDVADYRMRMFNMDGSESQMCGNGIRCVGKYISDHGMINGLSTSIETLAGIKYIDLFIGDDGKVCRARVDMGVPIFDSDAIPTTLDTPFGGVLSSEGDDYRVHCLSMGNPHAIIFVDDTDGFDVDGIGAPLESHEAFPERSNIEFTQVVNRKLIKMRVYERGSGETLACGTGASATAVVCIRLGLVDNRVDLQLVGGTLTIEYTEGGTVYMTGPATEVFTGEIELELE